MSRSPHRDRGDAAESWSCLLFGEIVRVLDREVAVREGPTIKLPRSGRWETGLARLRPALDDALGATALAVAWRWACAEKDANAWPGLPLVARKATDRAVKTQEIAPLAVTADGVTLNAGAGARTWTLVLRDGRRISLSVTPDVPADWSEVDRVADVAAAWLDCEWERSA